MAVTLITGCSTGIGLASALAFGRVGDTVVATMRDTAESEELKSRAEADGVAVEIQQLDVRDDASVSAAVSSVLERHGRIDTLVNNAGVAPCGAFENMSEETIAEVWDTNVFGVMRMTRAVLPLMREQGSGTILNVSSIVARFGQGGATIYASSKAAVSRFSYCLAMEVFPLGIRVAAIEPGFVGTPILQKVADSLPTHENPYSATERRINMMFQQAAADPEAADDPAAVAEALVQIVGAGEIDDVQILVGASVAQFAAGAENVTDRDVMTMAAIESDEEYFGQFMAAYPPLD